MDYCCARQLQRAQRLCAAALKSVTVEQGIAGATPDSAPGFAAMGRLVFESRSSDSSEPDQTVHAGRQDDRGFQFTCANIEYFDGAFLRRTDVAVVAGRIDRN